MKEENGFVLEPYKDETQIGNIMSIITKDLSEPYSIYTYRYFINNWPELCILVIFQIISIPSKSIKKLISTLSV